MSIPPNLRNANSCINCARRKGFFVGLPVICRKYTYTMYGWYVCDDWVRDLENDT